MPAPAVPAETAREPTAPPAAAWLPAGARVLLLRLSALGDVLFALEALAALAHERPDVRVDFLVEDRFAALLQGHPQIDRLLVYPRKRPTELWQHLRALRERRYDLLLDLHGNAKSAAHVLLARARRRVGFAPPAAREGAHRVYDLAVPMPSPLPHRADCGHRLLHALGLSGVPRPPLLPVVPPPSALLADVPQPRVLLHPGTSPFAAFKRWPAERFADLARALRAQGHSVLVSHGPGERELAAPIAAVPGVRAIDGQALGLRGLAGVLQQCAVVVAADTGPLHIAAALGSRCVALFGPKDAARFGPRAHGGSAHRVLWAPVPCRPCTRRTCVSPQCILGVPVAAVHAAVLAALAEAP